MPEGEPIYFDTGTKVVCCRKFNSQAGKPTIVGPDTSFIILDLDCLTDVMPRSELEEAAAEVAELLKLECGAAGVSIQYLDTANRSIVV